MAILQSYTREWFSVLFLSVNRVCCLATSPPTRQLKISTLRHLDTSRGNDIHDVGCDPFDREVVGKNRLWPVCQVPERQLPVRPVFIYRLLHHTVLEKHACPSGRNNDNAQDPNPLAGDGHP